MTLAELKRNFEKRMNGFNCGSFEVYRSFLRIIADCFLSDHTPEHPREKDYFAVLDKYKNYQNAGNAFAEMLADVSIYMQEHNLECLSELWEDFSANAHAGQFFTPWSVCQMMADLHLKHAEWDKYTPERKCGISDPSCGGGRTLIAALKKVPANKLNSVYFHGIDIDSDVCYCAALNMLFFNANSYIVHGNALTLEVWHVYRTIHSPFGGSMVEITDPELMAKIIRMGLQKKTETEAAAKQQETAITEPKAEKIVSNTGKEKNAGKRPEKAITEEKQTPAEMEQGLFVF